jgi:hypothetical protein
LLLPLTFYLVVHSNVVKLSIVVGALFLTDRKLTGAQYFLSR